MWWFATFAVILNNSLVPSQIFSFQENKRSDSTRDAPGLMWSHAVVITVDWSWMLSSWNSTAETETPPWLRGHRKAKWKEILPIKTLMWDLALDILTRIEVKTSANLDIVLRADSQGRLQFSQRRRGSCDYNRVSGSVFIFCCCSTRIVAAAGSCYTSD